MSIVGTGLAVLFSLSCPELRCSTDSECAALPQSEHATVAAALAAAVTSPVCIATGSDRDGWLHHEWTRDASGAWTSRAWVWRVR